MADANFNLTLILKAGVNQIKHNPVFFFLLLLPGLCDLNQFSKEHLRNRSEVDAPAFIFFKAMYF